MSHFTQPPIALSYPPEKPARGTIDLKMRSAAMLFGLIGRVRESFGYDKYSAETFDRLIYSMHVEDLRWVGRVTVLGALLAVLLIIIVAPAMGQLSAGSKIYDALVPFQISAVLAGAGGVMAWCYKTGSERLGIVDLFACEITTLCRICTVNGLTNTCIAAFELDGGQHDELAERFSHFDSSENYTPVFDANAKELKSLNVKVVTNITAFYTYWKSTRDAFRRLAHTEMTATTAASNIRNDAWHRAMRNVIYMQFLTLESARKAVRDLIEFEPASAENTITILLSELPAYRFLLDNFEKGDVRHARLELRRDRYREVVPNVYYSTKSMSKDAVVQVTNQFPRKEPGKSGSKELRLQELRRDWDKAHGLLKELESRYKAAIGEFPPEAQKNRT